MKRTIIALSLSAAALAMGCHEDKPPENPATVEQEPPPAPEEQPAPPAPEETGPVQGPHP